MELNRGRSLEDMIKILESVNAAMKRARERGTAEVFWVRLMHDDDDDQIDDDQPLTQEEIAAQYGFGSPASARQIAAEMAERQRGSIAMRRWRGRSGKPRRARQPQRRRWSREAMQRRLSGFAWRPR